MYYGQSDVTRFRLDVPILMVRAGGEPDKLQIVTDWRSLLPRSAMQGTP